MSFYMRTASGRIPHRSRLSVRAAIILVLVGYPAGCIVQLVTPNVALDIFGLFLVLMSVLAFFWVAPSYVQRIAGEVPSALDDVERDLRHRAYAFSYTVLTALAAAAVFYLAVANDDTRLTLWAPQGYAHWNAIFFGVLIYSFIMPAAWLAWTLPEPDAEDLEGEAPVRKGGARIWLWSLLALGGMAGFVLARLISG
jgi:hypothetical protein